MPRLTERDRLIYDLTCDSDESDEDVIRPTRRPIKKPSILVDSEETISSQKSNPDLQQTESPNSKPEKKRRLQRGKPKFNRDDSEDGVPLLSEASSALEGSQQYSTYESPSPARSQSAQIGSDKGSTSFNNIAGFKEALQKLSDARDIELLYPQSLWPHLAVDHSITEEQDIILRSLELDNGDESLNTGESFEEIIIEDFTLYRDIWEPTHPGKIESLNTIAVDHVDVTFCFDGYAVVGRDRYYLQGIPIKSPSIGGYFDSSIHSTHDQIWIQSVKGARYHDIWYKLSQPSPQYKATWKLSLWLADFAKHFLDYLNHAKNTNVALEHFKSNFIDTLKQWHGSQECFRDWYAQVDPCTDFRKHVVRFEPFLKHEFYVTLPERERYRDCRDSSFNDHDIWGQVCPGFRGIDTKAQSRLANSDFKLSATFERTLVTPNVFRSFTISFPEWTRHKILKVIEYTDQAQRFREDRIQAFKLPNKFIESQENNFEAVAGEGSQSIAALQLERVATLRTTMSISVSHLSRKLVIVRRANRIAAEIFQYAFVAEVREKKSKLRVVWLLLPSQTESIGAAYYPIGNELFISDECNCGLIKTRDVIAAYDVSMFSDRAVEPARFFVRERYLSTDATFVFGQEYPTLCKCSRSNASKRSSAGARKISEPPSDFTIDTKLRSLSLFSGCGLLDWGLEGSSAVETGLAVDLNRFAVQTHAINSMNPDCEHLCGSVNPMLEGLLSGKTELQQFDAVIAGSPCKGFSRINSFKDNPQALQQCSLVAVTISFVELFMPLVFLMENVPDIDSRGKPNACQQLVAFLVALGYQVQKWLLDSSNYGSPQKRKRVFILAVASHLPLPLRPQPTCFFGLPITVQKAMGHLASVHNDVLANIESPDHIPVHRFKCDFQKVDDLSVVHKIPKRPYGMNMFQALQMGLLKGHEKDWAESLNGEQLKVRSPCLRRIDPTKSFPTVVTFVSPKYGRSPPSVHWVDDRVFTLEEARIAMGCPAYHVLIGPLKEQMKQMGNGVPFELGRAVGKSIAEAWSKYLYNRRVIVEIPAPSKVSKSSNNQVPLTAEQDAEAIIVDVSWSPKVKDKQTTDMEDNEVAIITHEQFNRLGLRPKGVIQHRSRMAGTTQIRRRVREGQDSEDDRRLKRQRLATARQEAHQMDEHDGLVLVKEEP